MMMKVYYVVNRVGLFILLGVFLGGWHYQSRKVNYSKLENLLKEEKK